MKISETHIERFEAIRRDLRILGYSESRFLQVETLFFEALNISKSYGGDPNSNRLYVSLRTLQCSEYKRTSEPTKKAKERELNIRRFVLQLKKILSTALQQNQSPVRSAAAKAA